MQRAARHAFWCRPVSRSRCARRSPRDTEAVTQDPWIGTTVAERYVISRLIGRGGIGVVYEATHVALGRKVAIKILEGSNLTETERERFRREAKLASKV